MGPIRTILVSLVILWMTASGLPVRSEEDLPILAEVGPWPVVSRLIVYDGRLWFANSVKGRNHNSADIYSLGLDDGVLRYERHLFSQDLGRPLVYQGRLYWPFEDSRVSLGWGQVAVTDGEAWRIETIPTAQIFHVHDLAAYRGELLAATSAWRAGLQASTDGGATWREVYDHPTPDGRVSRIVELIPRRDEVLMRLRMRGQSSLLRLKGEVVEPVPGWPQDGYPESLATQGDDWLAVLSQDDDRRLVRGSDRVTVDEPLDLAGRVRQVATDPTGYALLSVEGEDGRLWRGPDGQAWDPVLRLVGGRPQDLLLSNAGVFAGGTGPKGRGVIWGRVEPGVLRQDRLPLAQQEAPNAGTVDWPKESRVLAEILADPQSYVPGRGQLRDAVYRLAKQSPPNTFFTELLAGEMPGDEAVLIGGAVRVPADHLARWILFWGMSLTEQGQVPVAYLRQPWATPENRSQKYFQPFLAALMATERIGQNDRVTIGALVNRLSYRSDPLWLKGDLVGVLSSLTGQRFAYDFEAWRAWWDGAETAWPDP